MAQLVVIVHPEQAAGFRLAGVETYPAAGPDVARRRLLTLLDDDEIGIIAMEQTYLDLLEEPVRRRLEESVRPVVIGIPAADAGQSATARRHQMAELIRRAIGVRIAFRSTGEAGTP